MTSIEHLDSGPSAQGRSDAPTLLFLHGLGGTARAWRPQFEAFSPTARCVAWTMPGYGRSAPLPDPDIAELAAAAATLLEDLGIESAAVVGHSLGGFVGQELALARPDLVGRLVLVATTAAFGKPGSSFNETFLAARLEPLNEGKTPADLAASVVAGLVGPTASDELRAEASGLMATITAAGYRQALAALVRHDATDRLPDLPMPTLGIAGELDTTASPKAMRRLVELIPGARLEVVPDAGHLINLEQPALFNTLIAGFVD